MSRLEEKVAHLGHSVSFHKFKDYRVVLLTTTVPFLEDDVPAG